MKPSRPSVPLARVLERAASDLARLRAPSWQAPRPAPAPRRWRAWAGPALAGALLLPLALWIRAPLLTDAERLQQAARASGFLPVAPADRWPEPQATTAAWLVTTELSAERLAALGLPFDPGRAAERVSAELLLDSAGDVLAVRVLRAAGPAAPLQGAYR